MKIIKDFVDERACQEYYEEQLFKFCGINVTVDMNTDGRFQGNLFEFKYPLKSLSKTLFQCIKYLSSFRLKGVEVPSQIFIIDGKTAKVYQYNSFQFDKNIHTIYNGQASKNNEKFFENINPDKIYELEKDNSRELFRKTVIENNIFHKINISEDCVVSWALRFYKEKNNSNLENLSITEKNNLKNLFLNEDGELRKPTLFKDFINPYSDKIEKFKFIMDQLNDSLKKKETGAFYTPILYAEKSVEMVRNAIKKIPKDYDYIILDRCAGTGNLERLLTDDELSHCILNTLEYFEHLILKKEFGNKVRAIFPIDDNGNEKSIELTDKGYIKGCNALEEDFLKNKFIQKFIDDKKCAIIVYENPPFLDGTSNGNGDESDSKIKKSKDFLSNEMAKYIKNGSLTNDISNIFIWSAFNYYIKNNSFSQYIVYSPIKYWKNNYEIINNLYYEGYIFNRKRFHAPTPYAVACIRWGSEKTEGVKELSNLNILDIDEKTNSIINIGSMNIKRCDETFSGFYECISRKEQKILEPGLKFTYSGDEREKGRSKAYYHDDFIAYLIAQQFDFQKPSLKCVLIRGCAHNGNGFYINRKNYLNKLPLFAACQVNLKDFWKKGTTYTTSDGGTNYEKDYAFLKSSLIFTALSQNNHCKSLKGSDKRDYFNELCFDTRSQHKPQALIDLEAITKDKNGNIRTPSNNITNSIIKSQKNNKIELKFEPFTLTSEEKILLNLWEKILDQVIINKSYDKNKTYGLYQIKEEINTFHKNDDGINIPDNLQLNDLIVSLEEKLKEYYKKYIEPKCFEYELLK